MSDIINFQSTGTEAGYSKAKKWLGCGARAAAEEAAEAERNGQPWPLFPEEGKPIANTVGSLLGELQQRYYRGEPVRDSAQFAWNGELMEKTHPLTCQQVRDLYKAYVAVHDPDSLGEVVACEVPIEIPEELFGMRLTGAIDMVVRLGGEIYLVDFKTQNQNSKLIHEEYSLNPQLWLYALGYELATGVKPVGLINEITIKNKTTVFRREQYEGLTEQRLRWLKGIFEEVKHQKARGAVPRPNEENCLAYFKPCKYLINGVCSFI